MRRIATLLVGAALFGCGGDTTSGTPMGGPTAPRISVVAPQQISVGDKIEVVGSSFADQQNGKVLIRFRGHFIDDQGVDHDIDRVVDGTLEDQTRVSWQMWPDVVFHPEGNRLGYFLGEVYAINQGFDGSQQQSDGFRVKIDVKPSLLLRVLRPANSGCPMVVSATNDDVPLTMAVEALGFAPGTSSAPLEFTWTFGLESLDVRPEDYGTWNLDEASKRPVGTATIVEQVTEGTLSGVQDASGCTSYDVEAGNGPIGAFIQGMCRENNSGQKQFIFRVLDDFRVVPGLKVLRTRQIENSEGQGHVQAPVSVIVRDAQGRTGNLAFPIDVFTPVEVKRDASKDRVITRDEVLRMQDEVATGSLPVQVSLRESNSEQRTIDSGHNVSPSYYNQLGFIYGTNLTWAFGLDQRKGFTTSTDSAIDVTQDVPPGYCLTYYRQAEQISLHAKLIGHTACGATEDAGELVYKVWQWKREVATGAGDCPAPIKKLAPAGDCVANCEVIRRDTP